MVRESGRLAPAQVRLSPGRSAIWDGRFHVFVQKGFHDDLEVGPLGEDGLRECLSRGSVLGVVPAQAALSAPAFRRDGTLIAVPHFPFAKTHGSNKRSSEELDKVRAMFLHWELLFGGEKRDRARGDPAT